MNAPGGHVAAKRMDAQGFVSKNGGLEKADCKKHAPWLMSKGNMVLLTAKQA